MMLEDQEHLRKSYACSACDENRQSKDPCVDLAAQLFKLFDQ